MIRGMLFAVTGRVALIVGLALVSSLLDALGNVLELAEAEQVPEAHALRPSLITNLARRPRWLAGLACDALGFATAAAALGLGAVAFVQPLLAIALLMSLALGSLLHHRTFRRNDWIAAVVLCAGLATFLYQVPPEGGRDLVPVADWLIAGPAIAAAVVICMVAAQASRGPARALLLSLAASIGLAASAVLTKAFVHYLGDGIFGWVDHWEPYAMAVVIITFFVVMQTSFQTGHMAASIAGLQAPAPVIGVILGAGLLDETINVDSVAQVFLVVVSLMAVVGAIIELAQAESRLAMWRRSPSR